MKIGQSGRRYQDIVPDTLDLAERARLAVHGIMGSIDPDMLMMYFAAEFCTPQPCLAHHAQADTDCDPKFGEALPMLRLMCGSDENADLQARYFDEMLGRIQDGLYWDLYTPRRPWRNDYGAAHYGKGKDEDFASLSANGFMMRTLNTWRQCGADAREMDDRLASLAKGLRRVAVFKDDYAYYPEKGGWGAPCCYPRSGWLSTEEPANETDGAEGSVISFEANEVYGLALWYARSGDADARDLAARLSRFIMKERFWGGVPDPAGNREGLVGHVAPRLPDPAYTNGAQMGHWHSHFHSRCHALRALLKHGVASNDQRVLEFVRRSYEFSLGQGIARIGWINCFPAAAGAIARNMVEGCALGDLVALGIGLSDAGLGDYWDDVDAVVRNHLAEQQLLRRDELERIAASVAPDHKPTWAETLNAPGQRTTENVIPRILGVFGPTSTPVGIPRPWIMQCCTGNASRGLYYAWEGAVREDGDSAQVNLLLNRASRVLDVHSHLPYEGKVEIRNKAARRIAVRIPAWVDRREMRVSVDAQPATPDWVGNPLLFSGLAAPCDIVLTFPIRESTAAYTVNAHSEDECVYTCTFRASTLVDISPRDAAPTTYPFYRRMHLRQDKAPRVERTRFVADRIVKDW